MYAGGVWSYHQQENGMCPNYKNDWAALMPIETQALVVQAFGFKLTCHFREELMEDQRSHNQLMTDLSTFNFEYKQ